MKGDRIWVGYRCDMQVTPLTGKFGADVADIDISQPLSAHELSELREAFAEYSVLAIREQDLTIDSFEAFALQLGNFGETPFITPVDGHPSVLRLLREADEAGPLFGSGWHSDWSFQDQPPSATLLYGVDIPPAGGDTAFTQQEQAYDALSDGMKELLEPLHGVHSARRSYGPSGTFGQRDDRRSMEIIGDESALETRSHPLIRTHPDTGRKSLLPAIFIVDSIFLLMTGPTNSIFLLCKLLVSGNEVNTFFEKYEANLFPNPASIFCS